MVYPKGRMANLNGISSKPGQYIILGIADQMKGIQAVLWVFFYLLLLVDGGSNSEPNVREEICQWSSYEPSCEQDEVVIMERAEYGRMQIGQCVSEDLGYLGCKADVLHMADRKCSGRRTCSVQVPDAEFESTRPCSERQSYLEAQYRCVKVLGTERRQCGTCDFVKLTALTGYIASATTEETGCGSADCPWLVEAQPGQQIRVRLLDFGFPTGPVDILENPNVCRVYAVLKEETTRRSVTICGGHQREKDVYTTSSNTLEVRILGKSTNAERSYFMLHYTVLGCADLPSPAGGWVKRHGDSALVGCSSSDDTWRLTCNGTHWIGVHGECPQDAYSAAKIGNSNFSFEISIAIVVIIAVFVGSLILIVGLVCFRRHNTGRGGAGGPGNRRSGAPRGAGSGGRHPGARGGGNADEALYHERGMLPQVPVYSEHEDGEHTLKGHSKTYSDVRNDYAHIWEMPLPQQPHPSQLHHLQQFQQQQQQQGGKGPVGAGGEGRPDMSLSMPPLPGPLPLPPDV